MSARKAQLQPFLALDIREATTIHFANVEEARDWIDAERKYWNWAHKPPSGDASYASHDNRNHLFNSLNLAANALGRYKANPKDPQAFTDVKSNLEVYAASGLASNTPRARFINHLKEATSEGPIMAHSALSAYLNEPSSKHDGSVPQSHRHLVRRGRIAIANFDAGIDAKGAAIAMAAFQEIAADNKQAMAGLLAANQAELAALEKCATTIQDNAQAALSDHAQNFAKMVVEFSETRDAIIKRLEDARAQYCTTMELQAPVDYWNRKGAHHKTSATRWGWALGSYAGIGTLILALGFVLAYLHAYDLAVSGENKFNHLLVLISAGLLAGTTILFWAGRFLQRLYVSERHMAIDAKQRAIMAQTYLALASNQKVAEKDRSLVLAPLFRAGSDGLIAEDKDTEGVAAILSRALARP